LGAFVFGPSNNIDGSGYMGVIEYKVRVCLCDDNNGLRYTNVDEIA